MSPSAKLLPECSVGSGVVGRKVDAVGDDADGGMAEGWVDEPRSRDSRPMSGGNYADMLCGRVLVISAMLVRCAVCESCGMCEWSCM